MNDPLKNRLALNPIGFSSNAGRWRTEAMRSHSSPRLIFFYKGQGRMTVAGLTAGYGPNNLIFIPAHVMYGFDAGPTVFGQILSIPSAMASEWPDEHTHLRLREVHAQKEIALHFDNLERELGSDRTGHSRAAHYYLGILSVFFQRQLELRPAEMIDVRSDSSAARLVAAYTDLVERDYASGQGVAEYARSLGVTPTHLTRCCNQTCGRSALAILNDRILYEARLLLRETKQPIKDISAQLGFTSAAYFSRSFQAHTGKTPSSFRKTGQGQTFLSH
ncbi:helix-turn-helix domain-containing protein [Flavimaricola marinus]|uniref:Arabinose operon regulatory protein n=1 Tax=Flavimaricola marinus TaxID=1819565 RepID=A0A238LDK1_9RHOB|nr:AraC family transcriptional regulator [Flavimaricola marinus]SMY07495.1 Arabinose operon regulatory protein [Flavimaricola marinus]